MKTGAARGREQSGGDEMEHYQYTEDWESDATGCTWLGDALTVLGLGLVLVAAMIWG